MAIVAFPFNDFALLNAIAAVRIIADKQAISAHHLLDSSGACSSHKPGRIAMPNLLATAASHGGRCHKPRH